MKGAAKSGCSKVMIPHRPTSDVLRPTSYVLRPRSYVLRLTSYVLRPTSSYVLSFGTFGKRQRIWGFEFVGGGRVFRGFPLSLTRVPDVSRFVSATFS